MTQTCSQISEEEKIQMESTKLVCETLKEVVKAIKLNTEFVLASTVSKLKFHGMLSEYIMLSELHHHDFRGAALICENFQETMELKLTVH